MRLWAKIVPPALAQLNNMTPEENTPAQTYPFLLTQEEANTILNALAELPFKVSNPLINNMIKQFQEHTQVPSEE